MSGARHAGLSATTKLAARRTGASTGTSPWSRAAGWSARRSSSRSRSRPTKSPWPSRRSWSPPPPDASLRRTGRRAGRRPSPARLLRAKDAPASVGASVCRELAAPGAMPSSAAMASHASRPTDPAADVIVIGGGIVGVSCAAHLAASGRRVVLLERTAVAAGASGRNSGVVQHPFDPVLVELHLETLRLYRALAGAGRASVRAAGRAGRAADGRPTIRACARAGRRPDRDAPRTVPELPRPREASAVEPALAPDVSACRLAIGYPVAPAAATRA